MIPWLCKIRGHRWRVPTQTCGDEVELKYGVRVCERCKREESLFLTLDGQAEWKSLEDAYNRLGKWLDKYPPEEE